MLATEQKAKEMIKLLRSDIASCQVWSRKADIADLLEQQQRQINDMKNCANCTHTGKNALDEPCNNCWWCGNGEDNWEWDGGDNETNS